MENSESRRGFGTTVLVLLLALAFLVGTILFVYVGYELLFSGRQSARGSSPTPTVLPSPTATLTPSATATARATAAPTATREPSPTLAPTKVTPAAGEGNLPQTGLGPVASVASLLLAGVALGARWLRHRR
jgi:hypothetical protein